MDLRINSARVPMLAGAQELATAGVRSTAHAGNVQQLDGSLAAACSEATLAMLVDPQTSGACPSRRS